MAQMAEKASELIEIRALLRVGWRGRGFCGWWKAANDRATEPYATDIEVLLKAMELQEIGEFSAPMLGRAARVSFCK